MIYTATETTVNGETETDDIISASFGAARPN